jgi:hypothetical protein
LTAKFSKSSSTVSPMTFTVIVELVSHGAKLSEPKAPE